MGRKYRKKLDREGRYLIEYYLSVKWPIVWEYKDSI